MLKMKALVLEDDFSTCYAIVSEIEKLGFIVDKCFDGDCALNNIYSKLYDIYILDINVPNIDGLEVLKYVLNSHPNAATIIISTHVEIAYLQKAFDIGCNDYLKKPFEMEELLLRVQNLIRLSNPQNNSSIINLSQGYTYCLIKNELFYYEANIKLTKVESLLLRILVQNIGNTVSLESIKNYVWDNQEVSPVTIRYWIYRLVKKLKSGMIINVRGEGYRLRKLDIF